MTHEHLALYSKEMLEERLMHLEKKLGRAKAFSDMLKLPGGLQVVTVLEEELENVRDLYSKIPAHFEDSPVILSAIQSEERTLKGLIERFRDEDGEKKQLDEELSAGLSLLEKKESLPAVNRIVPEKNE